MSNKLLASIIIVVLAVLGVIFVSVSGSVTPKSTNSASLSSLSTSKAPWQPEYNHISNRLAAINMPLLGAEGTAQHIHAHLNIFIFGQPVQVPAEIGIPPSGGITPIHTHDTSGIIHIESPDAHAKYTLGEFFDVWGVKLTDTSIGGYTDNSTDKMVVYDNGQQVKDPVYLVLQAHHEIAIAYGTPSQVTSNIPKSYNFPAGL